MLSYLEKAWKENPVHRLAIKTALFSGAALGFLLGLSDYATVYEGALTNPMKTALFYFLGFCISAWMAYPAVKGAGEFIWSDHGKLGIISSTLLGGIASTITLLAALGISYAGLSPSDKDLFLGLGGSAAVSSLLILLPVAAYTLWKRDGIAARINFHLILALIFLAASAPAAWAGGHLELVETETEDFWDDNRFYIKADQVEIRIVTVYRNAEGQANLTLRNTGNVSFDTTPILELYFYPSGNRTRSPVAYHRNKAVGSLEFGSENATCFQQSHGKSSSEAIVDPGETFTCDTNVEWPDSSIGLLINLENSPRNWNYTCNPSTGEKVC